ncbi:MAG: hypothetical protein IPL06_12480 [Betaproteobacteria bacterium]|nr:hypothetical protein [Betaproteobacteria bacterium]
MDPDIAWRWLRDFHLPAFVAALISVAYFRASSPTRALGRRLVASAHGMAIAALYAAAWLIYLSRHASESWATAFAALMLVPIVLMVASLFLFEGRSRVHWLLVPNLLCLLWVWLRGTAVITGLVF